MSGGSGKPGAVSGNFAACAKWERGLRVARGHWLHLHRDAQVLALGVHRGDMEPVKTRQAPTVLKVCRGHAGMCQVDAGVSAWVRW